MARADIVKLEARIHSALGPREEWTRFPGGWPNEIEAALLDAIFSSNARYGTKGSGVRAVIGRWRSHVDGRKLDSLHGLSETPTETLIEALDNRQRVPGRDPDRPRKGEAVKAVAKNLVDAGITNTATLDDIIKGEEERVRRTFTAISGVGDVTFSYFLMLLGYPDVKADRMICRFVADALGRDSIDSTSARRLIREVAVRMKMDPRDLDHATWQWQRRRR